MPLRDRALLEVLYGTGARISEAVGLDIDDLDLDIGAARLFGKGGKERIVPIGSYATESVRAWLVRGRPELSAKGRAGPAVFLNRRGRGSHAKVRGPSSRRRPSALDSPATSRRTP